MANIKVGDTVQITNGVLSGTICKVFSILRRRGASGFCLYLLSIPSFSSHACLSCYYEYDDIQKVEV